LPLPQKCPLDNTNGCRGSDCHLFHTDWRTREENCSIGYRYTHKTTGSAHVVEDTYARDVKLRKTQPPAKKKEIVEEPPKPVLRQEKIIPPETENLHDSFPEDEEETYTKAVDEIASTIVNSDKKKELQSDNDGKKTSKLDDMMGVLPEDYEKEFWSDEGEKI